jgi:hypothetical protein
VETYRREVIDPAKERLRDTEHPLTAEELKQLGSIKDSAPREVKAQYEMLDSSMLGINIPARNETADELFGSYDRTLQKSARISKPRTTSRTARRQRSCRRLFPSLHKIH